MSQLISIGYGNIINADKVVAIVSPDSAPAKRLVQEAKQSQHIVDATQGRKTKAVLVMEDDRIVLSALLPETIKSRTNRNPSLSDSSSAAEMEGN